MIQPIYTSVNNADLVPCGKKGNTIKSEPIPLLRNNFLSEYRTELEKAKVRKNLGIADEASLIWGNIDGTIEEQKDLVQYVEQKWAYTSDVSEEIQTVKDALDYALFFISQYEANTEDIEELNRQIEYLKQLISDTEKTLQGNIDKNTESINTINQSIEEINNQIEEINSNIENIDVDKNILNWIKKSVENSTTIQLKDDTTLEVILSEQEDNAIKLLQQQELSEGQEPSEHPIVPGLYVKNLEPLVINNSQSIKGIKSEQEQINIKIEQNTENISNIQENISSLSVYETELPDETESSVLQGTTVEQLKGKNFNEIIDTLLFPTIVRDLIQPQLYYSVSQNIVEVGTPNVNPTLVFVKNDAGNESSRKETISYNDEVLESLETYSSIGDYTYKGVVEYEAGEYLIDNKGEVTEIRIEAGSIEASTKITATYPWYAGNTSQVQKQTLVSFNQPTSTIEISLTGQAVIKLPGKNSQLSMFKVDGGLGFLDVDLTGWNTSTEDIAGFTYKVWTKKDSYSAILPHQLKFTLAQ